MEKVKEVYSFVSFGSTVSKDSLECWRSEEDNKLKQKGNISVKDNTFVTARIRIVNIMLFPVKM